MKNIFFYFINLKKIKKERGTEEAEKIEKEKGMWNNSYILFNLINHSLLVFVHALRSPMSEDVQQSCNKLVEDESFPH